MNPLKIPTGMARVRLENDFIPYSVPFHGSKVGMTLYCLAEMVDAVAYIPIVSSCLGQSARVGGEAYRRVQGVTGHLCY